MLSVVLERKNSFIPVSGLFLLLAIAVCGYLLFSQWKIAEEQPASFALNTNQHGLLNIQNPVFLNSDFNIQPTTNNK